MYAIYKGSFLFFTISILSILNCISNYIYFYFSFLRLFPFRLMDSFFFSFFSSFHRDSLLSYLYLHFLPPSSPHTNTRTHARRYKYTLDNCITLFPYLTIFLSFLSFFLFFFFEGPMAQQDVL